jgi:hypothetical protein
MRRVMLTVVLLSAAAGATTLGQSSARGRWFGTIVPNQDLSDPHRAVVDVVTVKPPALTLPAGDKPDPDLAGAAIHNDLERIVGFSLENQKSGDQAWGRITGFSGAANALQWATTKFREAGLKNVELQEYEGASPGMWQPDRWEARVLPDPSFGEGLESVVLGSAMPTSGSQISGGTLTAPLVDTGAIDTPLPQTLNVTGKVAVQYVSAASAYAARSNVSTRARDLGKRGAVAVINAFNQTGNIYVRDFGNCGVPCFNVGGRAADELQHQQSITVSDRARTSREGSLRIQHRQHVRIQCARRSWRIRTTRRRAGSGDSLGADVSHQRGHARYDLPRRARAGGTVLRVLRQRSGQNTALGAQPMNRELA